MDSSKRIITVTVGHILAFYGEFLLAEGLDTVPVLAWMGLMYRRAAERLLRDYRLRGKMSRTLWLDLVDSGICRR